MDRLDIQINPSRRSLEEIRAKYKKKLSKLEIMLLLCIATLSVALAISSLLTLFEALNG